MDISAYRFDERSTIEPVKVNGKEALYIHEVTDQYIIRQVIWMEDVVDTTMKFTVFTDDVEKLSNEELIRIANAFRK